MRHLYRIGPLMLLLAAVCHAQQQPLAVRIPVLKEKAERMNENDRGKAYSEIALEMTELANQQFNDGEAEKAYTSVKEVSEYAEKAAKSAKMKGKKIKDTEINLRKTARRLEEVQHTLALDDQPPLKIVVARIDGLRKDLLDFMFKKG